MFEKKNDLHGCFKSSLNIHLTFLFYRKAESGFTKEEKASHAKEAEENKRRTQAGDQRTEGKYLFTVHTYRQ